MGADGRVNRVIWKPFLCLFSTLGLLIYIIHCDFHLAKSLVAIQLFSLWVLAVEAFHALSAFPKVARKPKDNWLRIGVSSIIVIGASVLFAHIVTVLFGAHLFGYLQETLTFSLFVSCLAFNRAVISLGPNALGIILQRQNFDCEEELHIVAVVIGAWLGALPIPLDWDRPWQTWPLTCCFGAAFGELLSSFIIVCKFYSKGSRKNKAF